MLKSICFLMLTLVLFSSCTRDDSTRRPHEGPITSDYSPEPSTVLPEQLELNAADVERLNLQADEFSVRFVARLDLGRLEIEARRQTPEQRSELFAFVEQAAKIVSTADTKSTSRTMIVQTFAKTIASGCDAQLKDCRFLELFKNTPGSLTLLLAAAEDSRSDLMKRYELLSLAHALTGRVEDPRLTLAYLETAKSYELLLMKKGDRASRLALEQHREIFELSLAHVKRANGDMQNGATNSAQSKLITQLENSLDLWNFDRNRQLESSSRDSILFSIVGKNIFLPGRLDQQLDATFAHPNSAVPKLAKVSLASRKALGVPTSIPRDIKTLIFENVWLGRITASEADVLWNEYLSKFGTPETISSLQELAQENLLDYAQVRLLLTAREANAIITDFFNAKEKYVTSDAFERALKESLRGKAMWDDATRRFETLSQFNDRNLRSSRLNVKSTRDLKVFFSSIDRNIKILSTYPSMLVISYHLARLGFSLKIAGPNGIIDINGGTILDWFVEGTLGVWLPYGRDFRPLTKSEISIVIYYALELETLTDGGVDLSHFFKMLSEQMMASIRIDVERIDEMHRIAYEADPLAIEFNRICKQMSAAAPGSPYPAPQMNLPSLQHYTIAGMTQPSPLTEFMHPLLHTAAAFFETSQKGLAEESMTVGRNRLDENLEVVRLEFTPKVERMRMFARLTRDFLQRHSPAVEQTTMTAIDSKIQPFEDLRKRLYSRVFSLANSIGPCTERFVEHEIAGRTFAIEGLKSHFREVHRRMQSLRSAAGPAGSPKTLDQTFAFSKSVNILGLEDHERGLGFTSERYLISPLQMLLRMKHILEHGYVENGESFGPKREVGSIVLPTRIRDILWGIRGQTLRLEWNDDPEKFVESGVQQMFSYRQGNLKWVESGSFARSIQYRIRGISALAKVGTVDTDDGPQRFEPKEVIRQTLVMEKWLEVEGTWKDILKSLGERSRLEMNSMIYDFVMEQANEAWRGSLDLTFDMLVADKLGDGAMSRIDTPSERFKKRSGPMASFSDHSLAMSALGEPTLKIPSTAMAEITELQTKALDAQLGLVVDIIREVRRLEPLRAGNPKIFPSWRIYADRPAPQVQLLSDGSIERFRATLVEYSKRTDYAVPPAVLKALQAQ